MVGNTRTHVEARDKSGSVRSRDSLLDKGTLRADVLAALAETYGAIPRDPSIAQMRAGLDAIAQAVPDGTTVDRDHVGDVPGLMITPRQPSDLVILFFHGGGYMCGSSASHRDLAAKIAEASCASVFVADYRLAPEHQFPAAVDDAVAAWEGLVADQNLGDRIVLMGDSAGGGLTLAATLRGKAEGLPAPVGVVTMSPWTDMTLSSESFAGRADRDPVVLRDALAEDARIYLGSHDPRDPLASPLFGELSGFPPLLMHVGTEEVLHDDTLRFAHRVADAGGHVVVDVQIGMPHVHHLLWRQLAEARAAIDRIGSAVRSW